MIELRGLPDKDLFRVDEVAKYFGLKPQTIRRWIRHGKMDAEKAVGSIRITRQSILDCRLRGKPSRAFK